MKFISLLANLVIFHNALVIADAVRQLQAEGQVIDPLDLSLIFNLARRGGPEAWVRV
ncbi:Tn3 family transposase [Kitasatospora sp. GP82]|uniref:Tn3 family transposase n=1 Tax=Kitasatospora sp. GP82 TaxID=3035089 RepID=UPI0024757354|nr:Tn3 family transposase [Kitasatospora sp. GP82]MDH6128532.1 hypothetical protein [Kitasatospora sp. GP82]